MNVKKLVLTNLPYVLIGLVCTNLGEAWRMASGGDASERILSLFGAIPAAFGNPLPSMNALDLLIIENVGNLVCPAAFDLGEDLRIIVMSVTEGGDKPSKYPNSFLRTDAVVLNKMDILEASGMNLQQTKKDILRINPRTRIFETSCRTGEVCGVEQLAEYLIELTQEKKKHMQL